MNDRMHESARRDVEKRWGRADDFRPAAFFLGAVLALDLAVLLTYAFTGGVHAYLAYAVPILLGVGGLLALGIALRVYLRGRSWVPWQGAGWFLLTLMLPALSVPFTSSVGS